MKMNSLDSSEGQGEIEYDPRIQIPASISTLLTEDQAIKYELILQEMVEIENLINFNKIL